MAKHSSERIEDEPTLDAMIESVSDSQKLGVGAPLARLGEALVSIGRRVDLRLLSVSDGRDWANVLITSSGWPDGPLTALEQKARKSSSTGYSAVDDMRRRFRGGRCLALDLVNVLLVNREVPGLLRVQTVELYSDAVTVRWAKPARSPHEPALAWGLTDDRGTSYKLIGGGGGSIGRGTWHGHISFTPAPPAEARHLQIALNGEITDVPIP